MAEEFSLPTLNTITLCARALIELCENLDIIMSNSKGFLSVKLIIARNYQDQAAITTTNDDTSAAALMCKLSKHFYVQEAATENPKYGW